MTLIDSAADPLTSHLTLRNAPLQHRVRIGVFDSGLGGLSVLRAIHNMLPMATLLYVADSGHAPYGERSQAYIEGRSLRIAAFLRTQGAQILVVACNTATAAAVQALRKSYPDWAIVGVEPGIKPAVALTRNGRIGVLATEGTLRSDRFKLLAQAHAAHVELFLQACPGLAAAIESGALTSLDVTERVQACCTPLRQQQIDTVVLGCTHYPFVADQISAALGPDVVLVDTADAVARRTAALSITQTGPRAPADRQERTAAYMWTSGDPRLLADVAQRWLTFPCNVNVLPETDCIDND
jgi:glutamate racemase